MIKKYLPIAAFIAVIVAANWATSQYGLINIGVLAVTAGTIFAGLALIIRDIAQNTAGKTATVIAIIIGAVVSAVTSSPMLALASGIAFLVSELVDMVVYTPLRGRSVPVAVLTSSVVAAPVDTVMFLAIAGFPVTWQAVVGQFIVKTAMALIAAGVIWCCTSREPQPA